MTGTAGSVALVRWRTVTAVILGALMLAACSTTSTTSPTTSIDPREEVARQYFSTTTANPSMGCSARALEAVDAWLKTANGIKDTYNSDATTFEQARDAVAVGAVTMRTQYSALERVSGGFCFPPVRDLAMTAGQATEGYEALAAAMVQEDKVLIDAAIAQTSAAEAALYERYCTMASCDTR